MKTNIPIPQSNTFEVIELLVSYLYSDDSILETSNLTCRKHRRRLHRGSGKIAPVAYPRNNRGKSVILPRYYFAPNL